MIPIEYQNYIVLAFLALILLFQFLFISKVKRVSNASDETVKQNQLLSEKLVSLEKEFTNKIEMIEKAVVAHNDKQTVAINGNMDLNIATIREQIYKDTGLQNEIISNKLSAFQTILTERFSVLEKELIERFGNLETKLSTELGSNRTNQINSLNEFKENLGIELNNNFSKLNSTVETKLNAINNKVEERLMEGFKQTNKTFSSILERLSKIDEAQRKIDSLSSNIVSLQDILTDKKSRGTFGEVQLNQILKSVFGEKSDNVFELQKKLPNSYIADAVLKTPEPLGMVAIDSKFPLENYRRMINRNLSDDEQKRARREFKYNVKKHIDDISRKYIIPEVTSNQAIMFIPAEAIFAEINAYHDDLVDYSQKHRVWLASPTTLMSVLTTVQVMLQNIERERLASVIHDELNKLGDEFLRYRRRWEKLKDRIERVSDDVKNVHITTQKISNKFEKISKAELQIEQEPEVELLLDVPVDQN